MNDLIFTKEELIDILNDLDEKMSTYRSANNEFNRNLRDKIQRMIEQFRINDK